MPAAPRDVDPETRALVEDLTGFPYEKCWGNNRVVNFSNKGTDDAQKATPAA